MTKSSRIILLTVAVAAALSMPGCGRPPQIGTEKEALKAVDALYTACGLRDDKLVAQTEARLKALRESGKMPDKAFRTLEAIIAETRNKEWEPAIDRLSRFMEGQTR